MKKPNIRDVSVQMKQYILLGCVCFVIVCLVVFLSSGEKKKPEVQVDSVEEKKDLLPAEELWAVKVIDQMEKVVRPLRDQIQVLKEQLDSNEEKFTRETRALEEVLSWHLKPQKKEVEIPAPMARITVHEAPIERVVKASIPAGAFVTATLLSGLDAKASVGAMSEPHPVIFITKGEIAIPGCKSIAGLHRCHIVGSAYGDISSERVYMRLEKMSCRHSDGHMTETDVAGYVVGNDGRVGIRGRMVIRDVQFLARGAWGGVLAGLSNMMSRPASVLLAPQNTGNGTGVMSYNNMFQQGLNKGGSGALDRLSNYYIERAEQLQPVVQVDSGHEVTLVFTKGSALGSSSVKQEMDYEREAAKHLAAQSYDMPSNAYPMA